MSWNHLITVIFSSMIVFWCFSHKFPSHTTRIKCCCKKFHSYRNWALRWLLRCIAAFDLIRIQFSSASNNSRSFQNKSLRPTSYRFTKLRFVTFQMFFRNPCIKYPHRSARVICTWPTIKLKVINNSLLGLSKTSPINMTIWKLIRSYLGNKPRYHSVTVVLAVSALPQSYYFQ